jgi:hypothetical protein
MAQLLLCAAWLVVSACLPLTSCNGREKLPSDPRLASEDFGTGVHLLMPVDDARSSGKVECMTREQLQASSPYADREPGTDLVIALYSDEAPLPGEGGTGAPLLQITELRAYLAPADKSRLTLLGEKAAGLNPDEVQALLGPSDLPPQAGSDGKTHLVYYFAVDEEPERAYRLTTSHNIDGSCFAIELALVERPR